MICDRIKFLREAQEMTQSDLAKTLGITRSSVNAWEMGISVPSTQYIVELSNIFNVSSDFLLGLNSAKYLDTTGIDEDDIQLLYTIIQHLKKKQSAL